MSELIEENFREHLKLSENSDNIMNEKKLLPLYQQEQLLILSAKISV